MSNVQVLIDRGTGFEDVSRTVVSASVTRGRSTRGSGAAGGGNGRQGSAGAGGNGTNGTGGGGGGALTVPGGGARSGGVGGSGIVIVRYPLVEV